MPYFKKKHILFIHIPKTGGTTLKEVFMKDDTISLFTHNGNKLLPDVDLQKYSLQHQTYNTIYKYRDICKVKFDDKLRVITCVRNPYTRIISDLFYFKLITKKSSPTKIYEIIQKYISKTIYDNHNIPQYKFITDNNEQLIDNIILLKNETLSSDLNKYGFVIKKQYNIGNQILNYDTYLNKDSLDLINKTYEKDFILFNYDMKI